MRAASADASWVSALALLTGGAVEAGRSAGRLGLALIATGFADPVYVTAPRSEPNSLHVVQRKGRVYLVNRTAQIGLSSTSVTAWYAEASRACTRSLSTRATRRTGVSTSPSPPRGTTSSWRSTARAGAWSIRARAA